MDHPSATITAFSTLDFLLNRITTVDREIDFTDQLAAAVIA